MIDPRSVCVVLPAAGSGQRFGADTNKLFAPLGGRSLWMHAASVLSRCESVGRIVLAVSPSDRDRFESEIASTRWPIPLETVIGGAARTDSVAAALAHLADQSPQTLIAIHDAARPCLKIGDLLRVLETARRTGAAMLVTPVVGTIKMVDFSSGELVTRRTIDRHAMFTALTPQVFTREIIAAAISRHRGRPATDDAELVERSGRSVTLVIGSADNLKVTHPEDLAVAEAILSR